LIAQIQRDIARQQRHAAQARTAYVRQQQAMRRAAEQAMKAAERASVADERERKRLYLEARAAGVVADNADLQARVEELENLLSSTLAVDDYVDLRRLRKKAVHPPFDPGELARSAPLPDWARFEPPAPTGMAKMFGG
jgi:restriction system protein